MPRLTASKEDVTGQQELIPSGMYDVILKGFNPRVSAGGNSINLNPDIRIINHPTLNDKKVFQSMNTNAAFSWAEICHCFGVPLEQDEEGEYSIPGDFSGCSYEEALKIGAKKKVPWTYSGPLLNQQGSLFLEQVINTYNGKTQNRNEVKQFICRVDGCDTKHSDNLIS